MKDRVIIFDTTLRDGEQAPGASMTLPEKVRIAHQLARLGVDVLEAGFPISSPTQYEAVARIAAEVEGPVICGLARALEADIRAAGEALAAGRRTRIHTFIATSDIHIDAKFGDARFGATMGEKRRTIIRMAQEAVRLARTYTDDVEFSAEDAGRTDVGFLCEVIQAAVEAGATTVNIPDTTGYCTPAEYAALFEAARACLKDHPQVILSAHCHDDLGLAVANSLAAVRAGARQVECTINGIGERAGNAALEEIVMALHVRADRFGVTTGIDTRQLTPTSRMVTLATGFPVPPNKAIVGRNAFSHEAGIHQHGVLRRRDTYEIMRAEDVGQTAESIRLGRHSGRHGFFSRLEKLGLPVPEAQREDLYRQFVELADRKKEIFDEDLVHLVNGAVVPDATEHYRLERMRVTVDSGRAPEAEVQVFCRETGEHVVRQATGDGPVDALFRALDHAVGSTHELASYAIRSVTEGSDALGEVTVLLSDGGAFFRGVARHTDVLQASADAYVEALNQLATHRADTHSVAFVTGGIMHSFGNPAAAGLDRPPAYAPVSDNEIKKAS
ncbi:2-isopropylmalate synthase [Rhodocaloribacter litoris]|nr:2-isopropylmalate synthase [Rhodocaloribacter litoris]QXD14179.1 2-isopropylmalate synthase [Rhodocaloribacter litoris]